jgi:hypothetical protein
MGLNRSPMCRSVFSPSLSLAFPTVVVGGGLARLNNGHGAESHRGHHRGMGGGAPFRLEESRFPASSTSSLKCYESLRRTADASFPTMIPAEPPPRQTRTHYASVAHLHVREVVVCSSLLLEFRPYAAPAGIPDAEGEEIMAMLAPLAP